MKNFDNYTISTRLTAFGEMTIISTNSVSIGLTYQYGIRISYISAFNSPNLCYYDDKFTQSTLLNNGNKWFQLGGHRLWKSPEDFSCYYEDNAKAVLTATQEEISLVSPINANGLRYSIDIKFLTDTSLAITHKIENFGEMAKLGLWAITALAKDAKVEIVFDNSPLGFTPNRNIVLWQYCDINDSRIVLTKDKLTINYLDLPPLKVGSFVKNGEITYIKDNIKFTKSAKVVAGEYPDYCCNVECYANQHFIEAETLSPIYEIAKHGQKTHTELWEFERI
ncbi:MAG: hypothetical protein RR248_05430 [Clostridia bacterium]